MAESDLLKYAHFRSVHDELWAQTRWPFFVFSGCDIWGHTEA